MAGAAYIALTLLGSVCGIAFGPIQCRFSDALCVLPFLFPETAWGLFVGCLVSNILSPYGLLDLIVGSLTTLVAALLTARCPNRYLAPLPPVLLNGILVGGIIAFEQTGLGDAFAAAYWFNACSVTVGEAIVCYGLGLLLLWRLPRIPFFRARITRRYHNI
ncbi:MAG: QueT transporter family protein [Clostridiales bacterium]|nr:QueT transporter family protein [Candidatus Cacconaster stercorequi]